MSPGEHFGATVGGIAIAVVLLAVKDAVMSRLRARARDHDATRGSMVARTGEEPPHANGRARDDGVSRVRG